MTFEELRSSWQESQHGTAELADRVELTGRVSRRVERLSLAFFYRDLLESAAAGLGIWCFGRSLLKFDDPVVRTAAIILIAGCGFMVFHMHRTRLIRRRSSPDASVLEFCTVELERLNLQVRLLDTIVWWYIAPILFGVNLFYFGVRGWGMPSLIYLVVTLLLGWAIYQYNRYGLKAELIPARDELAGLLQELQETPESEEN